MHDRGLPLPLVLPSIALAGDGDASAGALPVPVGAMPSARHQSRLGFRTGEYRLMIPYDHGAELTDVPPVRRLPRAPAWFRGMANLHGLLVPVLDLAAFLDPAAQLPARPMLLVLVHGGDDCGVLIEGMPLRLRFDAGESAEAASVPAALAALATRGVLVDEQLWFELDVPALLDLLERSLQPAH